MWTRPRRVFPGHPPRARPLSRTQTHSLTPLAQLRPRRPPHTSLSHRAHPWSSAVVRCSFRDRRRASVASVASVSSTSSPSTRDTPWFAPFPSVSPGPRSPAFSPHRNSCAAVDLRLRHVPATVQAPQSPLSR
jgi:hypothetical protein